MTAIQGFRIPSCLDTGCALTDRRGRPLRVTGGPRRDRAQARVAAGTGAPRPRLMADRAYDGAPFRAGRAQRGTEAVLPARKGRTNPQPYDLERYPARNAVARGLGWLPRGRRVAPRYDPYAHRCLGFLYLTAAWIWLQSYLNTP